MDDAFGDDVGWRPRFWMGIATLYGLWLAALTAIVLLPAVSGGDRTGALVMTGLAEIHQDPASHESMVLRQLRRP